MTEQEIMERLVTGEELAALAGRSARSARLAYTALMVVGAALMTAGWIAVGCQVAR